MITEARKVAAGVLRVGRVFRDATTTLASLQLSRGWVGRLQGHMQDVRQHILQVKGEISSFLRNSGVEHHQAQTPAPACSGDMLTAYTSYMAASGGFITAATAALDRLASAPEWPKSAGDADMAWIGIVFLNLWNFVVTWSDFCDEVLTYLHMPLLTEATGMQQTLGCLTSWLLPFLHNDTPGLQMVKRHRIECLASKHAPLMHNDANVAAMAKKHGSLSLSWQHGALKHILPTFWPLKMISWLPTHERAQAISLLPAGLVENVSCLACDLMGGEGFISLDQPNTPAEAANSSRHSDFICDLPALLGNLTD